MSWLGGLLGSTYGTPDVNITSLLQKLQDSLHTEETKKTVEVLKDVAPKYHKEIGEYIEAILRVIKGEKENVEIVRDCLEILLNITTHPNSGQRLPGDSIEYLNTQLFLKESKNTWDIIELLEGKDSIIRYYATKLLCILAVNRHVQLEQAILSSPTSIGSLVGLLRDSREVVRNEALLLLLEVTKSNQEIQKILAFEGTFDILLAIIHEEGLSDGGIIVQDCLCLINNLIRGNVSNQNYFRETSCIKKLPPLLQISKSDNWIITDDKTHILCLTLELISLLVSGNNPSSQSNQAEVKKNNLLPLIFSLALGDMSSSVIRTKALRTIGDVISGNKDNCIQFSSFQVTSDTNPKPQSSLSRLLMIALNAKDIHERSAAVRVFKCYLFENEELQMALASTLTPSPATTEDNYSGSIGTILLNSLLGWESSEDQVPLKSWYASCILCYALKDNAASKELVLKIPLEIPKPGVPIVTLLTKCMRSLILASKLQSTKKTTLVKIGLLKVLTTWLDGCSAAVKAFLSSPNNLPFIVEQVIAPVSNDDQGMVHVQGLCALLLGLCVQLNEEDGEVDKSSIHGIISQRIGVDHFMNQLDKLRKTDHFVLGEQGKAETDTLVEVTEGTEQKLDIIYYDYDFTTFFKSTYDNIQRQFKLQRKPAKRNDSINMKSSSSSSSLTSLAAPSPMASKETSSNYQEAVLQSYKELIRQQDRELESIKQRNLELEQQLQALQQGGVTAPAPQPTAATPTEVQKSDAELIQLNNRLKEEILALQEQLDAANSKDTEIQSLSLAYNDLEKLNNAKDNEIAALKEQLAALSANNNTPEPAATSTASTEEYNKLLQEYETLKTRYQEDCGALQSQLQSTQAELEELKQRYNSLQKEQDELLIEMANQSSENDTLKARLEILEAAATQTSI